MKKLLQAILFVSLMVTGAAWAGKVDINNANEAALIENLEGVGPVKAKAIVDYRKKHGKFKTYDDLMQVPGIGVETVKKNKSNLSLSGGITKASSSSAKKASSDSKKSVKEKTKSTEKKAKEKASKAKKDTKKKTEKKADKAKDKAKKSAKDKAKKAEKKAKDKAK